MYSHMTEDRLGVDEFAQIGRRWTLRARKMSAGRHRNGRGILGFILVR
jgi:hypothetical protein